MTSTDSTTNRLVAYPIEPLPRDRAFRPVGTGDGTADVYGYCADFCSEGPTHGQEVEDHGPWCLSPFTGEARESTTRADALEVYLDLAQRYNHGVYRVEDIRDRRGHDRFIRLAIIADGISDDLNDDAAKFYFTFG